MFTILVSKGNLLDILPKLSESSDRQNGKAKLRKCHLIS